MSPLPPLFILDKNTFLFCLTISKVDLRIPLGRFSPNSPFGFSDPIPAYTTEKNGTGQRQKWDHICAYVFFSNCSL